MTFWSNSNATPKRNYRWQLTIGGFDDHNLVWWAKTVNVPSFDVSEVEHNYFDNKYYFPGRVSWSEIEVTLVDPVSPDAAGLTLQILERAGYNVPATKGPKDTISKSKSTSSGLGDVTIDLFAADVDNSGTPIESWTLQNAFIKAAKFGDLDYSNDELRTISLTLRYDWAVCTTKRPSPQSATFTEKDGKVDEIFSIESE